MPRYDSCNSKKTLGYKLKSLKVKLRSELNKFRDWLVTSVSLVVFVFGISRSINS